MSDNNNQNLIITATEPEVLPAEPYDFEFMTFALGLVPICNGEAAISLGNISSLAKTEEGNDWILTMISDEEFTLTEEDMANLDRLLRDRKAKRKDNIKDELSAQFQAQTEIQNGVQPGKIVGVLPQGKRFRQ